MSVTRSPRCRVKVAGESVFPTEANVHVSIHQSADTFFAKLPLLPAQGLDAAFWGDTTKIPVTIEGVNDVGSSSYTPLLIGQVDQPQLILHENAVALRGRDLTASLTDKKTHRQWVNQTDQQVITDLAQDAGLTVQFGAEPIDAGLDQDASYFSEQSDQDSAWNMIVALARKAGCIAFVKGTTLYVQPIDAAPPNGVFTVAYRAPAPGRPASSSAVMLFATRNLHLAKDATVTVQSSQHQKGEDITSSFQSKTKSPSAAADKVIYTHRAANLTKQQQDRIARAHLKATLSHERQIDISNYPGDVAAIPGLMGLKLTGTGTKYDQTYIFSDAVHRFSLDGGYTMDLIAHSQDASRGEPTQLQ